MTHRTVLLQEAIEGLEIESGDIFVDATLGEGGHTELVCKKFGDSVRIIGLDEDAHAIEKTRQRLKGMHCQLFLKQSNFRSIDKILDEIGIKSVNKILFDLGLSSYQLEQSGRGFSFKKNEPLWMTFKDKITENDLTAEEIVNHWQEENIGMILWGYGEERFAKKIAKKIIEARDARPIKTTTELVKIILDATPSFYHHKKIHAATRTFQALRIAVNDEIEALKEALRKSFEKLSSGGRIAVISFHSVEDRQVKNFFRDKKKNELGTLINKKPIVPSKNEIKENPRGRSAKLRIISKK